MKNEYRLSRLVIAVLVALLSCYFLRWEDISVKIIAIPLFLGVAVLMSFIGTIISKKIIKIGDRIPNIILRVVYYLVLLVVFVAIPTLLYSFISHNPHFSDGASLGDAVLMFILGCAFFIFVIIPYIQAVIILIVRRIMKNRE